MTQNAINNLTTGSLTQFVHTSSNATTKTTTTIPFDNTIPQNTEGGEMLTLTMTPTSSSSTLVIEFSGFGQSNGPDIVVALFQDSTINALSAIAFENDSRTDVSMIHVMTSGTTSATTFKIRIGTSSGNFALNSIDQAVPTRAFGGIANAFLTVKEYL